MCIKNQPSRQTGSRNQTGPRTLPTIWGTYMKLVTKYQSSAIRLLRKISWKDGRTEVKQYTIRSTHLLPIFYLFLLVARVVVHERPKKKIENRKQVRRSNFN